MSSKSDPRLDALGKARAHFEALLAAIADEPSITPEWKSYGKKHGWQLKLVAKNRAVAYLIPHDGYFTVAVALRPAGVAALTKSGLPPSLVREVEAAKGSTEGKPARIEVRTRAGVAHARALIALKLAQR